MDATMWTAVGSIAASIASIVAAVSLVLLVQQVREAKRATYAQTFIAASTLLQDEDARNDRGALFVFGMKPFAQWTTDEQAIAQRVVQKLDIVAVMVHEGMLPEKVIVENWGDTYRRTWNCTQGLVAFVRKRAEDSTFFFRFDWLAQRAKAAYMPLKAPAGSGRGELVAPAPALPTYVHDKMAHAEPIRREPERSREGSPRGDGPG